MLGVREAGPARASVIAGAAPLIAVTIAVSALGEPAKLPLVAGAVLIVAGGLALIAERDRPEHFRAIGLAYAFGCTSCSRRATTSSATSPRTPRSPPSSPRR